MEISEFMNKLGSIDLSSFIKVLEAYQEAFKEGFSEVEYFGFNEDYGSVYCCLNGNIVIFSRFGQNEKILRYFLVLAKTYFILLRMTKTRNLTPWMNWLITLKSNFFKQ